MQRDMALFREILLRCEQHEHGFAPKDLQIDGATQDQIGFHVHLLGQAGLLRVTDATSRGATSPQALPISLTNAGYDFLEHTRDPDVWQKTQTAAKQLSGWTVRTLVMIATEIIQRKVSDVINGAL
jgi:hypothetical protein